MSDKAQGKRKAGGEGGGGGKKQWVGEKDDEQDDDVTAAAQEELDHASNVLYFVVLRVAHRLGGVEQATELRGM
eukprot:6518965-Prymnesium_polylepis.1